MIGKASYVAATLLTLVTSVTSPVTAAAQGSPRLRLEAPSEARAGTPVPITLRVENAGDRPLDLHLRGRTIAFDVVVTRAEGDVVWRRLEGEIVPAILQLKTLAPGEVLELRAEWNQRTNRGRRVAPGVYSVRGELLTDMPTPLRTEPVEIRVAPR